MIFGQLFFGFAESTNSGSMTGDVPLRTCSFIHDCSVKKCAVFLVVHFKSGIDLVFFIDKKNKFIYTWLFREKMCSFFSCSLQIRHWFCFLSMKKQIHLYMIVPWKSVQFFLVVHFKSGIDFVFLSIKNKFIYTWLFREKMCSFFSCSLQFRHWFCFLSMKKPIHLYIFIHDCSVKKCAVFFSCSLQILLANSEFIISKFTYSSNHLLRQYLELFFWV
jgi:hypothetical protein